MATPWLTSDDIIESVKRKISMPIAQNLFSEEDILKFANEEMAISQVPSILQMHEEYLVTTKLVPMQSNQGRYPIPDRAIGMKLRDLFWQDSYGNIFQMSQITEEDKAFFQRSIGANQAIHKYYVEGNDVVLAPTPAGSPTGYLMFVFYLRPNQLVKNNRAALISSFCKKLTVSNTGLLVGDKITVNDTIFTAVASGAGANQFNIGANDSLTATNIATAITSNGVATATSALNIVTITYPILSTQVTSSNSTSLAINSTQGIVFSSIPDNITNVSYVDFLQTKPGHKIRGYDILVPQNAISGNIIFFTASDVPADLVVGDYVCSENECIIPQIPPDLHTGLAERTSARILAAMGDTQGLQMANEKIGEIEKRQGTLLDSRVDGSPRKITNKYSLLRWGRLGTRRRF